MRSFAPDLQEMASRAKGSEASPPQQKGVRKESESRFKSFVQACCTAETCPEPLFSRPERPEHAVGRQDISVALRRRAGASSRLGPLADILD